MPNFTDCAQRFMNDDSLISRWGYDGPVRGLDHNKSAQISYEGCKVVCGTGYDPYDWPTASSTITTWILPVIGVILQAPFESNAFWKTVFTIARWVGSPMAALSSILWNISVSGKCAMIVDMSVRYDHRNLPTLSNRTDFASMRDSFYILINMNMFAIKPVVALRQEAEGLLRIALFSKDLRLIKTKDGRDITLEKERQELAFELRSRRRRSVVPVFISTMWFLFSLAISIESSFARVGDHTTAHDLAIGLLLAWLPILIMCSIVDRNPVAAEDVRSRLNVLVDMVAKALQEKDVRDHYIEAIRRDIGSDSPRFRELVDRVERIAATAHHLEQDFFQDFAGQGRVRWHYGAAQPILTDIETSYIAIQGREWLRNEPEARLELVLGSSDRGLISFDFRQLWHIASGVVIVGGTALGAWVLSYYTPTVGLGCRSGGYSVYLLFCTVLLLIEYLVWWFTTLEPEEQRLRHHQVAENPSQIRRSVTAMTARVSDGWLIKARIWLVDHRQRLNERVLVPLMRNILPKVFSYLFFWTGKTREKREKKFSRNLMKSLERWQEYTTREWTNRFLQFVELYNTGWLGYICLAQTFGWYQNCDCMSSIYAPGGGYIDLQQIVQSPPTWVFKYWIIGTTMSSVTMSFAMIYVVTEWCLQSHLSTEDAREADRGLRRVRAFRNATSFIRRPMSIITISINRLSDRLFGGFLSHNPRARYLIWTRESKAKRESVVRRASEQNTLGVIRRRPVPGDLMGYRRDSELADLSYSRSNSAATVDAFAALHNQPIIPIIREPSMVYSQDLRTYDTSYPPSPGSSIGPTSYRQRSGTLGESDTSPLMRPRTYSDASNTSPEGYFPQARTSEDAVGWNENSTLSPQRFTIPRRPRSTSATSATSDPSQVDSSRTPN